MATAIRESLESVRCGWPAREQVDEQLRAARRAIVEARHASEDALADATVKIRRHPLRAVGGAAALGVVFGSACGFAAAYFAVRAYEARQ